MQYRVANGVRVECRPGRGSWSDWDYVCTLSGRGVSGSPTQNTYGYNVNSHQVTGFSG